MALSKLTSFLFIFPLILAAFPPRGSCPSPSLSSDNQTLGICPTDFTIIGGHLEPVHQSTNASTGLAVDCHLNIYLAYPRNSENPKNNVVKCTSFIDEEPWPNAEIQNCAQGQDPSTCFINVQNPVYDSLGQMWVVDSGIPYGAPAGSDAIPGGAKIMVFDTESGTLKRTYVIPTLLLHNGLNSNDLRINNTNNHAFITDESKYGSLVAINLETGDTVRRLFNTSIVKSDPDYVGSYNGEPIYCWNGTQRAFCNTGADGIALQSGNLYWGVLASRRFYYISQEVLINFTATDEEVLAAVQVPGNLGSEQAGFTADDKGRMYMLASEQNAIYYVQTQQKYVTEVVNGVAPGGSGLVPADRYVVKSLVRNGLIQHADSAAIYDGWLYFNTNQLNLGTTRQYNNTDHRRGPFRSYRLWIGAGPAV